MKILILTLDDYPHCGGKSTHISSLIDGLKYNNVDYEIISRNNISKMKNNLYKIMIYPLKFINQKKYAYLRKINEFNLFKKVLKKKLINNKYEYVSCQDALACTAYGQLGIDSNITLTMHTYFGLEYTLDNGLFKIGDELYEKLLSLEEESLNYADKVVGVDERIYNHVCDTIDNKFKSRKDKIKVCSIINFTNTDLYNDEKIEHYNFDVLCVRRLVEKNGVIYAVKAMNYLKDYPNIKLHVYGNGPHLDMINDMVNKDNLSNVIVHGSIDNSLLPDIYKKTDVVLVPSITVNGLQEATSISAIEAMSCAIPVIASSIGGLEQMIDDHKTGILVEEKDSKKIAEMILKLYNNKEEALKIGKNARKYILNNNSHIVATKQYLDIFTSK